MTSRFKKLVTLATVTLAIFVLSTTSKGATTPVRIMCLGDSITVGYTDNPGWTNHPFKFGYRSGLYTRLTDAGFDFNLVGGSTEPWTGISGDPTHGGTYTPELDLRDFGQDGHRGYGGAGIWGNVNGWIAADKPDVILLLIGINGIGGGSQTALTNLVNSIVTTAPDVHLIIAQITPRNTFNQTLHDYNVYIRDTLVPTHAANGHNVTTVDLYTPFLTDPDNYSSAIEPGVLANGINHPDNPHYDLMAQAWYDGLMVIPGLFDTDAPVVDAGVDMVTWSTMPVPLDPNVIEIPDSDWTDLSYEWTADPVAGVVFTEDDQFDLAPTVTITNPATANPSVVTLTLTVSNPGKTPMTSTMTIDVYDTACKAAIGMNKDADNPTDIAGDDCTTYLQDLALLAANWLKDTSLKVPEVKPEN